VISDMSTDPAQLRTDIAVLLADLPDVRSGELEDTDIDAVAARLEQAHDLLVRALEAVEGRGDATRER